MNLQGEDMHFLFQNNWDAVPEGVNNTNRAETETHREEKQLHSWRHLLHFSFCMYTVTLLYNEYLFISFCVYVWECACMCVCV